MPPDAAAKTLLCCRHWLGHGWWLWLPTLLFGDGGRGQDFIFRFHDAHMIRQRLLGTNLTTWVPGQHDLHFDAQHTLSEEHMAHSCVDIVVNRVSTVNHQTIHKLHGLGPLSSELPRHHNLAALGPTLHNEPKHTIAGPSNRKPSKEFVA